MLIKLFQTNKFQTLISAFSSRCTHDIPCPVRRLKNGFFKWTQLTFLRDVQMMSVPLVLIKNGKNNLEMSRMWERHFQTPHRRNQTRHPLVGVFDMVLFPPFFQAWNLIKTRFAATFYVGTILNLSLFEVFGYFFLRSRVFKLPPYKKHDGAHEAQRRPQGQK